MVIFTILPCVSLQKKRTRAKRLLRDQTRPKVDFNRNFSSSSSTLETFLGTKFLCGLRRDCKRETVAKNRGGS
ncbi:hypothetical protein J437_LFUL016647 [Ladona fulva]|uniref:Uncharacterized protein n=1 Tax=Ladona fulva TaxID=123851 RepID=A0A8K0KRW3_LADFU|nr:hypothetical protein J437_LFUL016647 [Ladona fulva]